MSLQCSQPTFSNIPFKADLSISAPLAKPIETVQTTIENSIDTLIGDGNNKKRKRKKGTAIAAGSTVLVLSAAVALMNPRFSPKIMEKLKSLSNKAGRKAERNKHDNVLNKFYKFCESAIEKTAKSIQFISNFNSAKDIAFKWFCTEKKDFLEVKNKTARNILQKTNNVVLKVLKKPYESITKFFDNISKRTVLSKYSKSSKEMDALEKLIEMHKDKLSDTQKLELEAKLTEIRNSRQYFSEAKTKERFSEQEESMQNLQRDFLRRLRNYKNGFSNKWKDRREHIDKNLTFWAQEMLEPVHTEFETKGKNAVSSLVGEIGGQKGAYQEVLELLSPHLSEEENAFIQKQFKKTAESLRKANKSECTDYFGKKRDLTLGSAPTDVLSAVIGLGMSGIFLTKAENNDERISRLLTGVFPVVGGLATSMIFTAQLISGPIGMIAGFGIGFGLNKIGSAVNKYIFGNKEPNND